MSQTTRDIIKTYFETGDRPTQQQFEDWLDSITWYDEVPKVYIAKITQSGTDAPTATVIKNTLLGTPTWARVISGIYTLTIAGAFTIDKTYISSAAGSGLINSHIHTDVNSVTILVSAGDSGISNTFLKIEVYP